MNFTSLTDQELLKLIKEKDEAAFETLFERYYVPLCKKAYLRIPDATFIEEIVLDIFISLWKNAISLEAESNIRAYLYAGLRNNILYYLRTEKNRAYYKRKWVNIQEKQEEATGLQNIIAKETENHLNVVIKNLPQKCREAFTLSRFDHLSYKEISERMNISVNTVENHISKALKILEAQLKHKATNY